MERVSEKRIAELIESGEMWRCYADEEEVRRWYDDWVSALSELRDVRKWLAAMTPEERRKVDVRIASEAGLCRICGKTPTLPLILDYGQEYACQSCLDALVERGEA